MFMQGQMSIQQKAMMLIGRPVGISLRNGQGVSGVICNVQGGQVYIMQYMYATQFATFHYSFNDINDILPYPAC
ncbi:hypothetical protein PghCCS26_52810 [Paenibacillus glycanilyticus]|uniref:DUF2642 domain-containing protein n=2 Tax=Paenibacillus TaxID=44249 RepID=A0ABQ6NST0_9BACL|nr:hypothetical protein PghCCS26_52810 [Paenibacillus glycanilyticus]